MMSYIEWYCVVYVQCIADANKHCKWYEPTATTVFSDNYISFRKQGTV